MIIRNRLLHPDTDDGSSGDGSPANQGSSASQSDGRTNGGDEFVPREVLESYKSDFFKLKDQLKDAKAKIDDFNKQKTIEEENKLRETENFKELLERSEANNASLKEKINTLEGDVGTYKTREIMGEKVGAFIDQADFKIDKKYLNFIDFDSIKMDESGSVIGSSVKEAVDKFRNEHPLLIKQPRPTPGGKEPGSSFSSKKLTKAEFQKLFRENRNAAINAANKGLVMD